jgi:hypothetical protein
VIRYLGLDRRVRQSGAGPATHGHISKQGPVSGRHPLVEACWSAVRQHSPSPAPISASKPAGALDRNCRLRLSRSEDYAFAQPSLTKKKMRAAEQGECRRTGGGGPRIDVTLDSAAAAPVPSSA